MPHDTNFILPVFSEFQTADPLSARLQLQALTLRTPDPVLRAAYQQAFDAARREEEKRPS